MTRKLHSRRGLSGAMALAITAVLATGSPAGAEPTDLRSPDAREAAASRTATSAKSVEDVRSPDARQAAASPTAASAKPVDDLRSADARDAGGEGRAPLPGPPTWPIDPAPIGPAISSTSPATNARESFQWDDAAIGAGAALGLMLLLVGGTALISRRQGQPATS